MYLVVGLGNPGKKYDMTRHNSGFMVLDVLAGRLGTKVDKIKFKSLLGEGRSPRGEKLVLLKPQTYMNLSGEAVIAATNFYRLEPEKVIVIYDDVDIAVGHIRVRPSGSGGSHNGMRNIIYHLQSEEFPRVRLGIGPSHSDEPLMNFVLRHFDKAEEKSVIAAIDRAVDAVISIVDEGVTDAMNKYNGLPAEEGMI